MAISRIGAASAEAASVTLPGTYQNGDLAIIFAFRGASISPPTLPAGWTGVSTGQNGTNSARWGWKILTSGSDTSGTWTNATALVAFVFRGVATNKTPINFSSPSQLTSNAFFDYSNNAAVIQLKEPSTSWLVGFAGTANLTSTIATPPTNMTNETNTLGASGQYVGHDTNGAYISNGQWPRTLVNTGSAIPSIEVMAEIFAEQGLSNNYQQMKVLDGMSTTEKIR